MIRNIMGPLLLIGLTVGSSWAATTTKKASAAKPAAAKASEGGEDVGVIETNMGLGSVSSGGSLYAEAAAALYEADKRPLLFSFMAGMGGEAIVLKEFYWMTNKMLEVQKRGAIEKRTHWVGFEE